MTRKTKLALTALEKAIGEEMPDFDYGESKLTATRELTLQLWALRRDLTKLTRVLIEVLEARE